MNNSKTIKKALCLAVCAAFSFGALSIPASQFIGVSDVSAEEMVIAHDPSRDVQNEGVGNPFNYGERNTPADASEEQIRAINHKMTVQEVKYSLYKEIDEHWDLLRVRLGQDDREMVYALFIGLATRESTLGGNGDGSDIETAQGEGFGVSSAHAYGPMQTAVTAFADCNPTFMKEDDVPEMFQYTFNRSNFYDCIVSNHMGIRKIMHFIRSAVVDYDLKGYQIVRAALKAFNTGWANYTGEDDGYYKNYPDEIIALAKWYYDNGHLYDNVFTWTNDPRVNSYRSGNAWDWWKDVTPSLDDITETPPQQDIKGDIDVNGVVNVKDAFTMIEFLTGKQEITDEQCTKGDMNDDQKISITDLILLKEALLKED